MVTPRGFEPAITGVKGRSPKPLEDGAIWSGRQDLNLRLSLGMNEHIEIAAKDSLKPFFEFSPCFHYTTPAYGECFTHIHWDASDDLPNFCGATVILAQLANSQLLIHRGFSNFFRLKVFPYLVYILYHIFFKKSSERFCIDNENQI